LLEARDLKARSTLFLSALSAPVLNLIDYVKKIPKVVLGNLFEIFGQRLQVIYSIFCSHVERVGTGVFLGQTRQINGHFGYITKKLNKITICDFYGTYWSANRRSLSKVRHEL
jgi:hypothetical protein